MKHRTVILSENGFNLIRREISKRLNEEGASVGGGATNCAGINVGGAEGQFKNTPDFPMGYQERDIYAPKTNISGSTKNQKSAESFFGPALNGRGKGKAISTERKK